MKVYNKKQMASKLSLCVRTIDNLMQRGEIRYSKIGRRVIFTDEDILDLISRNRQIAFSCLGEESLERMLSSLKN